jgi:hypothetical protein
VKVTDELFNNLVFNPPPDAIHEFRLQKALYPAEFGGKASALINVVTKSGTNSLRATAFAYRRDDRLDAHNYFDDPDQPVPPFDQRQVGATLGGPLASDRTFFFVSGDLQDTDRSETRIFSVPAAALRDGDFSGQPALCDPLTRDPVTGACSPFPGNQIPDHRIDPIARELLERVPAANLGGASRNLRAVELQELDREHWGLRLDHRFSERDTAFLRFSRFSAEDFQPFGTSELQEEAPPGFRAERDHRRRQSGALLHARDRRSLVQRDAARLARCRRRAGEREPGRRLRRTLRSRGRHRRPP